jgi:DNA-binding NarL/FixJ family response regulator
MTTVATKPSATQLEAREAPPERTRVLVVDDHPAIRAGLRELLADRADFHVVAAVPTAESGLAVAERDPVDVAVADYQLGGRTGLWLSRKLKRLPQPPAVLIYSAYADGLLAAAAVVAEADAIVSKGRLGADLCEAIRSVASGRRQLPLLPPRLGESVRCRLDPEQQAIFGLLLAGIAPAEAAATLGLSRPRLEAQLWEMLRRLEGPPG